MNTSNKKSALPNITNWQEINWKKVERYVEKLQQRIYHAESLGNKRKVRDLQRVLLNSEATLLLSIREVTELNKDKRTSKFNCCKILMPDERFKLFLKLKNEKITCHNPKANNRVYMRKKNSKLKLLDLASIKNRVYQNIVKMALEPQWEAKFEPTSYGFRQKRNYYDAIKNILNTVKSSKGTWIFQGNFKGCFDNMKYDFILEQIKGFPQIKLIKKWLKLGCIDDKVFSIAEEDITEYSIIAPLLINIALHGMQELISIDHNSIGNGKEKVIYINKSKYYITRYADNFVIICESEKDANRLYEILNPYLKKRGLELTFDKIKVTNIRNGFDFLGFNIRRYEKGNKSKIIVKPSKDSIKNFRKKISNITKETYGQNVDVLISKLNPLITEIRNYWYPIVSKVIYSHMDNYIWTNIYKFLIRLHPKKSWTWIKEKYFKPDKIGKSQNKWILTGPDKGKQLKKMSWTSIASSL